jgi:aminoglycoside/choline kinase family phosphotransferase
LAGASWTKMVAHLKSHPFTLCHGDFHAANMLLLNNSDQTLEGISGGLRWFDWSEVGPWEGPTDLAQTMISDMKVDVFRQHARSLVTSYHQRLVTGGVTNYSLDQCLADFARGGPERWLWCFAILAAMPVV